MPYDRDMPDDAMLSELNAAGQGVDKAIQKMLESGLSPVAVASALLGGALCLVSKTMGEEGVIQLLRNAEAGVRAGDLAEK
jgi:hypothetical protein